jgi:hypothetical protein
MKRLLHYLLLPALLSVTYAQQDSVKTTHSQVVPLLTDLAYFLPSALLVGSIHETGHIALARLFGASNARWGFYRKTSNGSIQYGWVDYDTASLSSFGLASAHLGGVLFARGFAEGVHYVVSDFNAPEWFQQFFSIAFLIARFDMPRYVLQDAVLSFLNNKGSDIDDFVTVICGRGTVVRTLAYTTLLAIATVDLVWDWPRIRGHWAVLGGNKYHEDDVSSRTQVSLRPYVAQETLGVSIAITW